MTYSHHNSTHETGDLLDRYEAVAQTQEQVIMKWFRQYEQPASPSRCLKLFHPEPPLTSIRRAISNLTERGLLVKTDMKVKGPFGRPEHIWQLPMGQRKLF